MKSSNPHARCAQISAGGEFLAVAKRPSLGTTLCGLAAIAVVGLVAGCGSGGAATGYGGSGGGQPAGSRQPSESRGPAVVARKIAGVGTVLADRSGKTI